MARSCKVGEDAGHAAFEFAAGRLLTRGDGAHFGEMRSGFPACREEPRFSRALPISREKKSHFSRKGRTRNGTPIRLRSLTFCESSMWWLRFCAGSGNAAHDPTNDTSDDRTTGATDRSADNATRHNATDETDVAV